MTSPEHVTPAGNHYRVQPKRAGEMLIEVLDRDSEVCNSTSVIPYGEGWVCNEGYFDSLDAVADRYDWRVK